MSIKKLFFLIVYKAYNKKIFHGHEKETSTLRKIISRLTSNKHCCHDKFKTMCSNTLITIVYLNSSFPFTDSLSFWPSNSRSTNPILPTNHRQLSPCNFERANLGCEGFSCPYFHRFQKYPLNWVNLVCLRRPEHWPLSSCRLPTLSLILGVPIQCDHDRCCPQCK